MTRLTGGGILAQGGLPAGGMGAPSSSSRGVADDTVSGGTPFMTRGAEDNILTGDPPVKLRGSLNHPPCRVGVVGSTGIDPLARMAGLAALGRMAPRAPRRIGPRLAGMARPEIGPMDVALLNRLRVFHLREELLVPPVAVGTVRGLVAVITGGAGATCLLAVLPNPVSPLVIGLFTEGNRAGEKKTQEKAEKKRETPHVEPPKPYNTLTIPRNSLLKSGF